MDIPVSRTKISFPARRSDWVQRPRLLALFYELLEFKLILVTAPAGYGKTTFMADVVHQIDIPASWMSLDELDQEPVRFITHFIAAIATRYPGFGGQAMGEIGNQSELNIDRLATILSNEVYDRIREHFLIVLDDYYLIEPRDEVREFISLFIQRTDENCHLALLTRKLPDLPNLTLLVGRTQVGGLSFRELAFTTDEIRTLIQQNYHEAIGEDTAQSLSQQTEGWVTGLLLSAQSRWSGVSNQMRVARASGIDLSAYLMAQVLNQQPDYLCYFLLQTSLLEEFNAHFCQRVLGNAPEGFTWASLIGMLLEKNLFIQPLENGWLRYHHLFRDFLQNQIAQKYPEVYKEILYNLAKTYAEEREWEKSRAIYLRLDDQDAIADLIEEASYSLAEYSRYKILANWIDALPYEKRNSRPTLISVRGITEVTIGDLKGGIDMLLRAKKLFEQENHTPGIAQTLIRLGFAYFRMGKYSETIDYAQSGLALMDESNSITRIEAIRVIGLAFWRKGDIQRAAEYLDQARLLYQANGNKGREAIVLIDLGIIYRAFGQYQKAEEAYQMVLSYWKDQKGFSYAAYTANNLGVLYHFQGKYKKAAEYLEDSISFADKAGDLRAKAVAYCSLGDLYDDLDIPEATRMALSSVRPIVQGLQDYFMLLYLDLVEAKLAHFSGGKDYAERLLKSAEEAIKERNSIYERGLLELTRGQMLFGEQPISALDAFERACKIFQEGKQNSDYIIANFFIALCKIKLSQENAGVYLIEALRQANLYGIPQSIVVAASRHKNILKTIQSNQQVSYALSPLLDMVTEFEKNLTEIRHELRQRQMPIPLGPPKMIIQGSGANKVWVNGVEIANSDWQTVRARDIFFYILENPNGVSREKIEGTFWPESSNAQLRFTFKKTMYRMRRAFEHEPVVFSGERYKFNYLGDYEYDVEIMEKKLRQADMSSKPEEKFIALNDFVNIYRGPLLPEVEGNWASEKREYLSRRYLEANLTLGKFALDNGDFDAVIKYTQNILNIDLCNEDAHRMSMRAYAERGNRSVLARQFELLKQTLMREYGLAPSQETLDLYKMLTT